MLSREAPPRQEVDAVGRHEKEGPAHTIDAVPDDSRAPARRPGHRHPVRKPLTALPFGSVELGLFLLVAFVLWWATRSWLLTLLLGLAWLVVVATTRALHRWRNASVERRRFSRERLTSIALVLFVIGGCLAGIRAWSTRHPAALPPDPAAPYEAVSGAAQVAWLQMYERPATVRAISQTAPGYWELTLQDSEGCWAQAVVIANGRPAIAGERTPSPCPAVQKAPTATGDPLDPAKAPPARVALDFVHAWLSGQDFAIYVAPGAHVAGLGRTLDATNLTAYALQGDALHALLWVTGNAADGAIGMRVALINDQNRWFVSLVRGAPAVNGADLQPLPAPTSTSITTPTTPTTPTAPGNTATNPNPAAASSKPNTTSSTPTR